MRTPRFKARSLNGPPRAPGRALGLLCFAQEARSRRKHHPRAGMEVSLLPALVARRELCKQSFREHRRHVPAPETWEATSFARMDSVTHRRAPRKTRNRGENHASFSWTCPACLLNPEQGNRPSYLNGTPEKSAPWFSLWGRTQSPVWGVLE